PPAPRGAPPGPHARAGACRAASAGPRAGRWRLAHPRRAGRGHPGRRRPAAPGRPVPRGPRRLPPGGPGVSAGLLHQAVLCRGDRVAFSAAPSLALVTAYLAALRLGLVAAPVNPAYTGPDLGHVIRGAEPRAGAAV